MLFCGMVYTIPFLLKLLKTIIKQLHFGSRDLSIFKVLRKIFGLRLCRSCGSALSSAFLTIIQVMTCLEDGISKDVFLEDLILLGRYTGITTWHSRKPVSMSLSNRNRTRTKTKSELADKHSFWSGCLTPAGLGIDLDCTFQCHL